MRCRTCGATTRPTARFCDQCGARLDVRAVPSARNGPDDAELGDRRIVTAVFADLVDYVRLVAEHDPEDVRRRVDSALHAMVEAIEAYDGTREKFIGDAIFAVFGWPRSHDDDALRAAHCALAIRAALARVDEASGEEPLQLRIGIATGEVVAAPRAVGDDQDWSLTGPAVTTAARIQALARPGEILLDDATLRAARKALETEDRGLQLLRGQSRPIRIARLIGEAGFQPWRPPVGPLVGRLEERALVRRLALSGSAGRGAVVVVEGEAGMGKSRLIADLEGEARAAGFAWTWVDNVSYGAREPYRFGRALAQALADEHGIDSGSLVRRLLFTADTPPEQARVWAGAVAAMARDAAFSGWEAEAPLAPAEPAAIAAAVRDLAIGYTERLIATSGPRVIVVDDLHWLDPSSFGMIEELIGLTDRLPLVLLFAARPELSMTPGGLLNAPRVRLTGLDEPETRELAAAITGSDVDPADARRLHTRTAGNPLFITETVRALLDEGSTNGEGRLALDEHGPAATVPVTLRALLGARIDALSDDARAVLRVASVIGVAFREPVVAEVLGAAIDPATYEHLADASLIVPLDGVGGWQFCHPLIHDAAYASLLASRRRRLHARVADRLESRRGLGAIGVVARHRAAAGDRERAVPLLLDAADEALAVGASTEAASFWFAAADLVEPDPDALTYRRRAREALEAIPRPGAVPS